MRKVISFLAPALILCAALGAWRVVAQTDDAEQETEKLKTPIPVEAAQIERFPEQFEGAYVQIRDYFGVRLERRDIPQGSELRRSGITAESHFAFTTHRTIGSNMICFIARDNEDAQALFDAPLVPETKIVLVGQVGRRMDTKLGYVTSFLVERVVRGHIPPPLKKEEKKKPLFFTLEWETEIRGVKRPQKQEYKIPEPGKRYEIPDPYDPTKKLYVSFRF